MRLITETTRYHRYALEMRYDQSAVDYCRSLKDKWGWKSFSFAEGKWRFSNVMVGLNLIDRFDLPPSAVCKVFEPYAQKRVDDLRKESENEKSAMLAFWKECEPYRIDNIKGNLYGYQKAAVVWLIRNGGKGILALSMGTGKSFCALAYAAHVAKRKVLVICPAAVKLSWEKEVTKWTRYRFALLDSGLPIDGPTFRDHDVFAASYDWMRRHHLDLEAYPFDLLILDEAHFCKAPSSLRSKAAMSLAKHVPATICLTGTPIMNRLSEIWPQLKMSRPDLAGTFWDFGRKFCGMKKGAFGMDESGDKDIAGFKAMTKDAILRYSKDDVLPWLPKKVHLSRPIALSTDKAKEYRTAEDDFIRWLKEVKDINKESACVLEQLNALRQITSAGKMWAAEEVIGEVIEDGRKVIVFSVYNAPLKELKEKLGPKSVMIIGETPEDDRRKAVDGFMGDPDVKVFLGGLKSAGAGLTLTSASTVLFLDFSWTPADHDQGEDRTHRPGQEADHVEIIQLYAPKTIDERMAEILEAKKSLIAAAMDGGKKEGHSMVNDLVASYLEDPLDKT